MSKLVLCSNRPNFLRAMLGLCGIKNFNENDSNNGMILHVPQAAMSCCFCVKIDFFTNWAKLIPSARFWATTNNWFVRLEVSIQFAFLILCRVLRSTFSCIHKIERTSFGAFYSHPFILFYFFFFCFFVYGILHLAIITRMNLETNTYAQSLTMVIVKENSWCILYLERNKHAGIGFFPTMRLFEGLWLLPPSEYSI